MEKTLGNLKILENGIIFFDDKNELTFKIENSFLKFKIQNNNNFENPKLEVKENPSNNEATIILYNVGGVRFGVFKPTKIFTTNKKTYFLAFNVQLLTTNISENNGYQLTYCWYVEE